MRAPHKPTAKFLEQAIHLTAMFIPVIENFLLFMLHW